MSLHYEHDLKTAVIDNSSSGDNEIISAPSTGYIAVDHVNLVPDSAVGVKFKTGSTDLSGVYSLVANQSLVLENSFAHRKGVITCGSAEAFNINLDSAVQISGFVRYRIVGL